VEESREGQFFFCIFLCPYAKKGQQFRSFATLAKRRGYTPEHETTGSAGKLTFVNIVLISK
jgi:hypothetical protein